MNNRELLEQANQRVVYMNKLMGEIEVCDDIIAVAKDGDIAFYNSRIGTTFITRVLSPEKLQELKEVTWLLWMKR